MTAFEIITILLALLGGALGVFNNWFICERDKVRLNIELPPRSPRTHKAHEQYLPDFVVVIRNLSRSAVYISDVRPIITVVGESAKSDSSIKWVIAAEGKLSQRRTGEFPQKLEARESLTVSFPESSNGPPYDAVRVETQCGSIKQVSVGNDK